MKKYVWLCSCSWCGKKQTLMITPKDGGEGNGAAASASSSHAHEREQEMVTLMNKEKIQENGNTEEFTVITLEESPDKEQQAWERRGSVEADRGESVGEGRRRLDGWRVSGFKHWGVIKNKQFSGQHWMDTE